MILTVLNYSNQAKLKKLSVEIAMIQNGQWKTYSHLQFRLMVIIQSLARIRTYFFIWQSSLNLNEKNSLSSSLDLADFHLEDLRILTLYSQLSEKEKETKCQISICLQSWLAKISWKFLITQVTIYWNWKCFRLSEMGSKDLLFNN